MLWDGKTIEEMVESYAIFLKKHHPLYLDQFLDRKQANPDGAAAEAITFSLLHTQGAHPIPYEDRSLGGVDFLCAPKQQDDFFVEVRSLNSGAISNKSGLKNTIENTGGAFSLITKKLRDTVSGKVPQVARAGSKARVLAITLSHQKADLLLNKMAAESLFLSDPKIVTPIGEPHTAPKVNRDLRYSVFFRFDETEKVTPCRQSISAIMLIAILIHQSRVVGILHPEPCFQFDIQNFPTVPFLRATNWPITDSKVVTEWLPANTPFATFSHETITDEESTT